MQTKGFFQSKIILLAILGLVLQLVAPLLGHAYDPATGDVEESIVEIIFGGGDWVNILINVLIIVARWLFTDTKISGMVKPGAGLLTAVLLLSTGSILEARITVNHQDNDGISKVLIISAYDFDSTCTVNDIVPVRNWGSNKEYQKGNFAILHLLTASPALLSYRRARDGLRCGKNGGSNGDKANLTISSLRILPTLPKISPVARLCRNREYKTAQEAEISALSV